MTFLNRKGSVTVFMSIILPVIIGSCILLSDACLYDSGKQIVKNSVDASVYTILGKYSGYLKENYDLYSYNLSSGTAKTIVLDELKVNLGTEEIFDFQIEDLKVDMEGRILDSEILLGLIEQTAVNDIYTGLVEEFTERFDMFSGLTSTADIITLKMKFDKSYKKIKDSMTALNKIISGDQDLAYYVNLAGFDEQFNEAVLLFNEYRLELVAVEQKIADLAEEIKQIPTEKVGVKILLEEDASVIRQKMADIYSSFIEGLVEGLKKANQEALNYIQDIVFENENIHILSGKLQEQIEKIDDCPVYLKEIMYTCIDLLKDVEQAFVEQIFEELRLELNENISTLLNLEEVFFTSVENAEVSADEIDITAYNADLLYSVSETSAGYEEDRRSLFEAIGKRVLEKQFGKDVHIAEVRVLPSDGIEKNKSAFQVTSLGQDTQSGESEIDNLKQYDVLQNDILTNLLINEYLLHHFSCEATDSADCNPGALFSNEIEYILWGSKSQNSNVFFTKAALMSTRFALNAIHVYSDSGKNVKAQTIAAATAGWWTMGAGIPVMSNLVKIAWAIAEAGVDTTKLWQGDSVAIIKTAGDWVTDIGLSSSAVKSPDFLKMDYYDYLRLYLMTIPMESKVMRMLDIIDLNSQGMFNVFDAYTGVTVTAVISFRSLTGGRHEIEVSATQSY